MQVIYKTKGVCASQMVVNVEDGIVQSLVVTGGCSGNLQGLSRLVPGMRAEDVISRLEGVHCGPKSTSCPDQLAQALKQALKDE
jgi:uncharacterized protein (TIGR03905 family)